MKFDAKKFPQLAKVLGTSEDASLAGASEETKKFKEAGLDKEQISYAKVLRRMGRTVEQAIEEAKSYEPMPVK